MNKWFSCHFTAYAVLFCLSAQCKPPGFHLKYFEFSAGNFSTRSFYASIHDAKRLHPASVLLKMDLDDFTISESSPVSKGRFAAYAAFEKQGGEAGNNNRLRTGLSYYEGEEFSLFYSRKIKGGRDTLRSTGGNIEVITDTTFNHDLYITLSTSQVRIDIAYLFEAFQRKRWMMHAGIGFNAGVTVDAMMTVRSVERTEVEVHSGINPTYIYYKHDDFNAKQEIINKSGGFCAGIYIPLSLSFNLGTNREFWKKFQVCYEVQPGINRWSIKGIDPVIKTCFSNMLSLKINIQKG